jgi:hypothetical protein
MRKRQRELVAHGAREKRVWCEQSNAVVAIVTPKKRETAP